MAHEPPKSRPQTPQPRRIANPQPDSSVYGGQWGGGDQPPADVGKPDRPQPIRPQRKEK